LIVQLHACGPLAVAAAAVNWRDRIDGAANINNPGVEPAVDVVREERKQVIVSKVCVFTDVTKTNNQIDLFR
jgi:hypothetical protein